MLQKTMPSSGWLRSRRRFSSRNLKTVLSRGCKLVGFSLVGSRALASFRSSSDSSLARQRLISSSSASLTITRQSRGQCEHASPTRTTVFA